MTDWYTHITDGCNVEKALFAMLRTGMWPERTPETETLTADEWQTLYRTARKQTLCGILFDGYKRWPEELQPPAELKIRWAMRIHRIEERSRQLNRLSALVTANFAHDGFRSCILKGQGVAMSYPNPMHRQAGDIDIWVEGGRERILPYLQSVGKVGEVVYHHIDFPVRKDVEIEVHTTPTWMNNPLRNHQLQRMFRTWSDSCFSHRTLLPGGHVIYTPTVETDQLYLLLHLYRHLFDQGVGLRHLTDYALVMDKTYTPQNAATLRRNLQRLGMQPFAGAVFHVLTRYLGYPAGKAPVCPDVRRGEAFMREVMAGGNFGHYDERNRHAADETNGERFVRKVKRNLRFLFFYPNETLSSPLFKGGHYLWRWKNGFL